MTELLLPALAALGFGALTVIHPCPLTANVAAIGFICGWARGFWRTAAVGGCLVLGFVAAYAVLGMVLSLGLGASREVVMVLQDATDLFLGPVLILVGALNAKLLPFSWNALGGGKLGAWLRARRWGPGTAFLLGAILALAFCPASASYFLLLMVPMATTHDAEILIPAAYGLGAGLPLIAITLLIAGGTRFADRLQRGDHWTRRLPLVAGWVLIAIGVGWTVKEVWT